MRSWQCSQGLLSGCDWSQNVVDGVGPSAEEQQQCQDLVVQ